uniref:Uncharacterized protein n=1 Tax=Steinernema glaseri TaxID=37863 RepID=A0A1I7Y8Q0_9BILA
MFTSSASSHRDPSPRFAMKIQWQNQNLLAGSPVEPGITCLDWMPWHPSTASSTSSDDSYAKSCCTGGYLSAGSESGVVGITYTDLRPTDKKRSSHI